MEKDVENQQYLFPFIFFINCFYKFTLLNQQYLCPFIFFINCFYKFTSRNVLFTDADEQRNLLDSGTAAPAGRASVSLHLLTCNSLIANKPAGVLLENRPAVDFCNYKENKKTDTRMLDTTNWWFYIHYGATFSLLES